jgi:hypothetical protein
MITILYYKYIYIDTYYFGSGGFFLDGKLFWLFPPALKINKLVRFMLVEFSWEELQS